MACQPHVVTFSKGTATAMGAGSASLSFLYRLQAGGGTDLNTVCYVTVVSGP